MSDVIIEDAVRILQKVDLSSLFGKTVLLTGATGLLGTHFLATLAMMNAQGARIKVFGVCHSDPEDHTVEIAKDGGLYLVDDNSNFSLGADVVIHAAGYAQPVVFTKNPAETVRVNTTVTQQLLKCLYPGGKFLFVSSSEVYSGLGGLVTESSIGNTNPLHPRACYIEGKRCGETIVNAYRQSGVDAKSVRLSLAYGPGTRKHDKRAMSQFIEQALTENVIELKYSGREPRTFCYISDAVEMMWQVLLHGKQPVYNVGGESVTNMAGVAYEISKQTHAHVFLPTEETNLPGAPLTVSMDLTRMKTEFGKRDFIGLEAGLKRTIDWQRGLYGIV